MEQPIPVSLLLEKITPTTNFDEEAEEYVLTPEEEEVVVENEAKRLKDHYAWKMAQTEMLSVGEIKVRLAGTKWEELIDKREALKRANSNKLYSIWQQKQREKERLEVEEKQRELQQTWNANQFYKLIKWTSEVEYERPLIVNDETMSIIKPLCFFLSGDERFEKELGFSFKKGLCFRGISGLGKTHIVKCAASNELHPILVVSMLEIASDVKNDGEYVLPQGYSKFYLDDVGSEEHIQNHYGTKINWFKNFIETFYLRSQQYNRLIISTNNTFTQIEEKYGFRVRSRFKDMFNVIDVNGKDLRG